MKSRISVPVSRKQWLLISSHWGRSRKLAFAGDSSNEFYVCLIQIFLEYVPKGPIDNMSAFAQGMRNDSQETRTYFNEVNMRLRASMT